MADCQFNHHSFLSHSHSSNNLLHRNLQFLLNFPSPFITTSFNTTLAESTKMFSYCESLYFQFISQILSQYIITQKKCFFYWSEANSYIQFKTHHKSILNQVRYSLQIATCYQGMVKVSVQEGTCVYSRLANYKVLLAREQLQQWLNLSAERTGLDLLAPLLLF